MARVHLAFTRKWGGPVPLCHPLILIGVVLFFGGFAMIITAFVTGLYPLLVGIVVIVGSVVYIGLMNATHGCGDCEDCGCSCKGEEEPSPGPIPIRRVAPAPAPPRQPTPPPQPPPSTYPPPGQYMMNDPAYPPMMVMYPPVNPNAPPAGGGPPPGQYSS